MNKRLMKFVIFTITILTAELIAEKAGDFLTSFKDQYKPLTFTLAAMAITVAIFYPLFTYLEKWVEKFSKRILKEGKNYIGPNMALIMFFFVSLGVLTFLYVKQWYGINILRFLFAGQFEFLA